MANKIWDEDNLTVSITLTSNEFWVVRQALKSFRKGAGLPHSREIADRLVTDMEQDDE